mgnify:FL=1
MSERSAATFTLRLALTSDWGVATGAGVAGGVDAVVERGEDGRPIIRGTVITGVMREQALNAAHALDGGRRGGPWARLATALFGDATRPRLVAFSDAPVTVAPATAEDGGPRPATHEAIGVSIDKETGTAKDNFLRLFERAGSGSGESDVTLLAEGLDRSPIAWTQGQRDDARLLLALAARLVTAVGSDRSSGDGDCEAALHDGDTELGGTWCADAVRGLRTAGEVRAPAVPEAPRSAPARLREPAAGAPAMTVALPLTIRADAPLVSYDVPYSNEVRSLDFLRGTVLLPWVHSRLRRVLPEDDLVRDAVVTGRLRVDDATPVVDGVRGLPVPLVLSRPKAAGVRQEAVEVWNRLRSAEPQEAHSPLRSGYVFYPGAGAPDGDRAISLGAPALVGRQSTAVSAATGAAIAGRLFMVRAIPAGVVLQAEVRVSADLYDAVGDRLPEVLTGPARLGSRRFSGTYGRAACRVGPPRPLPDPADAALGGAADRLTVWCTSDLLLRSTRLGPVDGIERLLRELGGARLDPDHGARPDDPRYAAGLRYRRVDGWSAADQQPRASRIAIRAGSAISIRPASKVPDAMDALRRHLAGLERDGVGLLREQGYGRVVVGHPLLERETFRARSLQQSDFTARSEEGQER